MPEQEKQLNPRLIFPFALLIGLLNGLFGSGGGMIAVPLLEKLGLRAEEATPPPWR
jgi:uncharacterized membrane protein YfcA